MVWYENIYIWSRDNYVVVGVIIIIALILLYDHIKRRKAKKPKEEKKPGFEHFPTPNPDNNQMPDIGDIDFEKDFQASGYLGKNLHNNLVTERNKMREEIEEKTKEYTKARERHQKNILLAQRISRHIKELVRQEKILSAEIERMPEDGTTKED